MQAVRGRGILHEALIGWRAVVAGPRGGSDNGLVARHDWPAIWRQPVGAALLILVLCGWGAGQSGRRVTDPPGERAERDGVVRVRSDEVVLAVSVHDAEGRAVSGLGPERFLIFDNGRRQEIISFNQRRAPVNAVLLLDASASVFGQMRFIRQAAARFIEELAEADRVCVMQFADRVELLADWMAAGHRAELVKALNWRYHPGQRTAFYDGLYLAAEEKLNEVRGRRIIVLLTDGLDTAERPHALYEHALNAVRRAEATVYVISLTASVRAEVDKKRGGRLAQLLAGAVDRKRVAQYLARIDAAEQLLSELAKRTGGQIFFPVRADDINQAYAAVAAELRHQYMISYRPEPRAGEGEWHRVRVLVIPGGYEVTTREGYLGRDVEEVTGEVERGDKEED